MSNKKVVLPEANDQRLQQAAAQLIAEGVCTPVLVGTDVPTIDGVEVIDPASVDISEYNQEKLTGLDLALVAGAAVVAQGQADAIVSGAVQSTGAVIKSYLRTVGLAEGYSRVASVFLMERDGQKLIYADCGVNPDPDAGQLAEIARMAQQSAVEFGLDPKVAFLSFSTGNSAAHEHVDKVHAAVATAHDRWPDMECDGPLQFDAAFVEEVADRKSPDSPVAGQANVFIFPDLDKPAHDLSRGCSVEDIVAAVKVAVGQCN